MPKMRGLFLPCKKPRCTSGDPCWRTGVLIRLSYSERAKPMRFSVFHALGSSGSRPRAAIAAASGLDCDHRVNSARCTPSPCSRQICMRTWVLQVLVVMLAVLAYAAKAADPDALLARADHLV